MTRTRNRSAWIWVALAALTLASVAQGEPGTTPARGYAHPVLQLLAGGHSAQAASLHGTSRLAQHTRARQADAAAQQTVAGAWLPMLPVLFIGLVSPLTQGARGLILSLRGMPACALLPGSFQRPPPLQFA